MAAKYDITLDQNSDFTLHLSFKDKTGDALDLAGATAKMHIKCRCSDAVPFDDLSTENGRITIEADRLSLNFPHGVSKAYEVRTGVYDLLLAMPDGRVFRMLEGTFTARPGVTA